MSAMEACLWPNRCTPVALGFKGSEWGSKLRVPRLRDAVFGGESLGMRPRNL